MHFSYSVRFAGFYEKVCDALSCRLSICDFQRLMLAINIAEREEATADRVTRKDVLAQLRAMAKIKQDDQLVGAVTNTDMITFQLISQAQTELISDVISSEGCFVDSSGGEYRFCPPSMDQYNLMSDIYLPDGVKGLRESVDRALRDCESRKGTAGPRKIESRRALAREVKTLWKHHQPGCSQKVWQRDGDCSPLLNFARLVFEQVTENDIGLCALAEMMNEK